MQPLNYFRKSLMYIFNVANKKELERSNNNNNISLLQTHGPYTYKKLLNIYQYGYNY